MNVCLSSSYGCDATAHAWACTADCGGGRCDSGSGGSGGSGGVGAFCGGIANLPCPAGQHCVLDGSFPDAGGHCEPGASGG